MLDADQIEKWADMGVIGVDTQIYDLSGCEELIAEIGASLVESAAPLFWNGAPPASRCFFYMGKRSLISENIGDMVRCQLALSEEAVRTWDQLEETIDFVQKAIAENPTYAAELRKRHPDFEFHLNRARPTDLNDSILINQGDTSSTDDRLYLAAWVSACCEFIAMPIAQTNEAVLPRAFRRRMERNGIKVSLTAVRIRRGQSYGAHGDAEAASRALHFVSGHWRRADGSPRRRLISGEWRIWIEGHWRGNPDVGIRLHRYIAHPADIASRVAAKTAA